MEDRDKLADRFLCGEDLYVLPFTGRIQQTEPGRKGQLLPHEKDGGDRLGMLAFGIR